MNGVHPLQQYIPQQMQRQPNVGNMQMNNPMQMMAAAMQAMRNPQAFVRQYIPGIPDEAFNDPTGNGVLQYMMNNLGVTQQDIRNVQRQMPGF